MCGRLFARQSSLAGLLFLLACDCSAFAQEKPDKKIPDPSDVAFETKDGVKIVATFYPGTKGRDTVPIIMLHMRGRSRLDYHELALALQQQGHAVLVPDLRGHGDSPLFGPDKQKIEVDRMKSANFIAMSAPFGDVEACKKFLMERNNAGELNIDKLCLVGAELGAIVALNWAALDWSYPPLATGKQGQHVKALVLLSPAWSVKGYTLNAALASAAVQKEITVYILTGKDERDSSRLSKTLEKARTGVDEKNLVVANLTTTLAGTMMLKSAELDVAARISAFIEKALVDKPYPWKDYSR